MSPPAVDLPALRAYLVAHAVPGLDDVVVRPDGGSVHRRLVRSSDGAVATVTVTLPPDPVGWPAVTADGEPDAVVPALAASHRWLGLDLDPAPGVAALAGDPVLGPLVRTRPHLEGARQH